MHNQTLRQVYRKARINHENGNHAFPFDGCHMPSCKAFWKKTQRTTMSTTTDPKKQLELLAAHQEEFELFLKELTGLKVTVSLTVHTPDNSVSDLLALFDASHSLPAFKQVTTSERTWITHEALNRNISVCMPKDFKVIESFPELDDDEGYAQAVEVANTNKAYEDERSERSMYDDAIPF